MWIKIILNNALDVEKGSSDINSALKYFNSITEYMMQLRTALGELRDDIEYIWYSTKLELGLKSQVRLVNWFWVEPRTCHVTLW